MDESLNYSYLVKRIDEIKINALTQSDISNINRFYVSIDEILKSIFQKNWDINFCINVLSHHTRMMIIFLFNKVDEGLENLKEKIIARMHAALQIKQWKAHEFITLAVVFLLMDKLKQGKHCESIWPHNQPGTQVKIPLSASDIQDIKKEITGYFKEKLALLNAFIKNKEIKNSAEPSDWLELVQRTPNKTMGSFDNSEAILSKNNLVISPIMAQAIRYSFYKIDTEKAENGIFPVTKYSAKEAADALGISLDQFITECFEGDFGVYIKKGDLKVRQYLHSPIIREEINAESKSGYVYAYRGLLRLEKTSKMYPDATLEKIYEGSSIKVNANSSNNYRMVPLQAPLSECARGISLCIELRGNQKISLDDLVFIKNEIDAYAITRKGYHADSTDKVSSNEDVSILEAENGTCLNEEKAIKKKVNNINHHVKKRTAILRAATAVTYRYNITSGKDVLKLIKDNIPSFFEGKNEVPHSDRVNTALINKYLRPLNECEFNEKTEKPFEDEKIFGAALSIVFHHKNQFNSINRDEASKFIAEKILSDKQLLNISLSLDYLKGVITDAFFQVT